MPDIASELKTVVKRLQKRNRLNDKAGRKCQFALKSPIFKSQITKKH